MHAPPPAAAMVKPIEALDARTRGHAHFQAAGVEEQAKSTRGASTRGQPAAGRGRQDEADRRSNSEQRAEARSGEIAGG
jgi:hypothetical protein